MKCLMRQKKFCLQMNKKPEKSEIKTILFLTLSNLGDIILTTPVLEKLHDEFPEAKVDVVTGPPGEAIFKAHPAVRSVVVRKRRQKILERVREVFSFRRKKYDMVVDLKNTLIPYFAGAKYHTTLSTRGKGNFHKKDEHLSKLEVFGVDPFSNNRFFMPVEDSEKYRVEGILKTCDGIEKVIVMNPGAKSHLKRWDVRKYAELSDRLVYELGCKVFLTGNADDEEVVVKFNLLAKNAPINICSKTTIGELSELMRRVDLVITNDSAPLHVASAVNAPTVAIFGPSNEKKYGPLSDKNIVIKPGVSCRPCEKALCSTGPSEGCIVDIKVGEVFAAAKELLEI